MSIALLIEFWRSYRWIITWGLWVAAFGGLIWYTHHSGYVAGRSEVQAKWDAAKLKAQQEAEAARLRIEAEARADTEQLLRLAQARENAHIKTMEKLRHEISNNRVYRDCVIPDSGLLLYRSAGGTAEANN